ncbi:MAG: hypothetical protein JKY57_05310 [Kordiimonadaceae bacterium]|nr:hypothetical protein [Kordiimonadaceae bacterium]
MAMFEMLPKGAPVGVIGPGGGRMLRNLAADGYLVDAFEGRDECTEHLQEMFHGNKAVKIRSMTDLNDPLRREKLNFDALICMDDLRAFRDNEAWTEEVQIIVRPGGYFVYSQVSNLLPRKKNNLGKYFKLVGNYNVSEETAKLILDSYVSLDDWDPGYTNKHKKAALQTLDMVEKGRSLRRSIRSGVEVRYCVWQRNKKGAEN